MAEGSAEADREAPVLKLIEGSRAGRRGAKGGTGLSGVEDDPSILGLVTDERNGSHMLQVQFLNIIPH